MLLWLANHMNHGRVVEISRRKKETGEGEKNKQNKPQYSTACKNTQVKLLSIVVAGICRR